MVDRIKRDTSLDVIAGILVIYMILGHIFLWSHTQNSAFLTVLRRFFFFFMAFFFYKSGMFYKERPISESIKRGSNKLLLPFFFYTFVGEIVRWMRLYIIEGDTDWVHYLVYPIISIIGRGGPSGNTPLWFLLALFLSQLFVIFSSRLKMPKLLTFSIALLLSYLGTLTNNNKISIPPIIWEVASGSIFFLCGNYLRELQYGKKAMLVALIIYICVIIFAPSYYDFRKGSIEQGYWIAYIISSISGIVLFVNFFKIPLLNKNCFCFVGKNSMQFFSFHWILLDLVCLVGGYQILEHGKAFGSIFPVVPNFEMFSVLLLGCILFLPIYAYGVDRLKNQHDSWLCKLL